MHITIKIALWVLGTLSVLIAGTFVYLRSADLSVYEDQIESILTDAVGHKVDVDGLFELRVGKLTYLTAEEIRITNADWVAEPQLLSIEHFSVAVNTMSLVSNPIIVEDLTIRSTRISVETDVEGSANWHSIEESSSDDDGAGQAPPDLNRIAFKHVDVQDVELAYDSPDRTEPLTLRLENLTVEPDSADILQVDLSGSVNEYPLTADGKVGPWRNFVSGKDLSANLALSLGRVQLNVDGVAEDLQLLQGVESHFELRGPEIERITEVFGLPQFASGEFTFSADITKHARGRQFHLAGYAGDINLDAEGNLDHLANPSFLEATIDLSGPDTKGVAEVFGILGAPDVPFQVNGDVQLNRRQLTFSEAQARIGENTARLDGWLEFDGNVPDADITFAASGPNLSVIDPFLEFDGVPASAFDVNGHIRKDGQNVDFDEVTAAIGDIRIGANGKLDRQGGEDTEVFVSVSGPDVSVLEPMTGLQDMPERPFSASAFLRPDPIGVNLDEAKLTVGTNNLHVDGVIGTIDGLTGTDISIHGFGPELQSVKLLTGTPYLPLGEYDYKGSVGVEGSELSVRSFDVTVVGAKLSANGIADIGANAGDFSLTLSASSDDVSKLQLFEALQPLTGESMDISGRISHSNNTLKLQQVSASIANLAIDVDGTINSLDGTALVALAVDAPDSTLANSFVPSVELPKGVIRINGEIAKRSDGFEFNDLSITLGEILAAANGVLSNQPMSNSSDLSFSLGGPDLKQFGEIFAIEFMPTKPFHVAGEVNGTPTGFAIENIDANVAENEIRGRIAADLRGKPSIKGSVSADYLDLASRLAEFQSAEEETTAPAADSSSPFLLPNDPLPLDFLEAVNVDLDLNAGRLILSELDVRDFNVGVTISNGALNIDPISFVESQGAISGHVRLDPADDKYTLDTEINVENIHFGLLAAPGEDRKQLPAVNGVVDIRGSGNTVHDIMATSDGKISFRQGPGRTSGAVTSRFFGDFITELLQTLNPMKAKEQYTNLECAFYEMTIVDGLATIEQLAIQTEKVMMAASGSVNFRDEKLKLSISAKPRKGFGISVGGIANSFFNVRGTLKQPALGINTSGTVTTTGAAIATGGLSLVAKGLWDRASSQESICKPEQQ